MQYIHQHYHSYTRHTPHTTRHSFVADFFWSYLLTRLTDHFFGHILSLPDFLFWSPRSELPVNCRRPSWCTPSPNKPKLSAPKFMYVLCMRTYVHSYTNNYHNISCLHLSLTVRTHSFCECMDFLCRVVRYVVREPCDICISD